MSCTRNLIKAEGPHDSVLEITKSVEAGSSKKEGAIGSEKRE